ncbi:MarR family transcriptional regulator [Robertmurraya sp. DFI.2.37]|uniref:MarR family winged helix-turn-helix transcriptional regulator n=1 Tax=Robertmurraya sp. DFI.2.37 TaxID=3031819 RepID=UPI0012465A37|nr:MarR family transcriptional regulator [Robertmurraya sp. DFI.2.37]MDF1509130.1 MarR family transcriptional regulator [Robertmurraya sp. DFI.2.37]
MSNDNIQQLVNRYVDVSFSVTKKAEALITEQLGSKLTHDQLYIIRYINRVGSCTSTALAEEFEVKKSAITAIINRLWEKGFIQRTRDEKDRRVVYLTLTEKGEELFWRIDKRIQQLVEELISQFEPSEIEQFIETYEKLNHALVEQKNKK